MSKFAASRDTLIIGIPEIKHRKNFILENIKQLKEMQKMMQQKTKKEAPKIKKDLSMKGNMLRKNKLSSSGDSIKSFATHISTPVTAVAAPKQPKCFNRHMQTSRSCNDINRPKELDKKYVASQNKNVKCVKTKNKVEVKKDKLKDKEIIVEENKKPIVETMSAGDSLKAAFLQSVIEKENKDFVKTNTYTFYPEKLKPPKPDPTRAPPSYKKGTLPKYLQDEKKEQAIKNCAAIEHDPLCPPGHIRLSDDERVIHLNKIKKTYAELISELNRLPVRSDSLQLRLKRINLEKELEKLEAGIKIFSKDVLYVKLTGSVQ